VRRTCDPASTEAARRSAAAFPVELRHLLGNLWRGAAGSKTLVNWAVTELVAGRDSHNLRILAGLSGDDARETEEYFNKALADLTIPFPDRCELLIQYCGDIARNVAHGAMPPMSAFNVLSQVTMTLRYPPPLRCWTQLEADLDVMEYKEVPIIKQETAVRDVCEHFLALLEGYTQTGVPRLSITRSLQALRTHGWDLPGSADDIPKNRPAFDGPLQGVHFFRTRLETEDFRDLTLPRTLFLRSEIVGCRFENTDLSESSMTWCDWKNCNFMNSDLSRCDLRRSIFRDCYFYQATFDSADLRGAQFIGCRFSGASMKGALLEKFLGLSDGIRSRQLGLSGDQKGEIDWMTRRGAEPPGG
jgi:Pentapeptide repeats (9 copies)